MELSGKDISLDDVEKILETKTEIVENKEVRYFKVQWKATWEPEFSLTKFCGNIIENFWDNEKSQDVSESLNQPVKEDIDEKIIIREPLSTDYRSQVYVNKATINDVSSLQLISQVQPVNSLPSLFGHHNGILPLILNQNSITATDVQTTSHFTAVSSATASKTAHTQSHAEEISINPSKEANQVPEQQATIHAVFSEKSRQFEPVLMSKALSNLQTFLSVVPNEDNAVTKSNNDVTDQNETFVEKEQKTNFTIDDSNKTPMKANQSLKEISTQTDQSQSGLLPLKKQTSIIKNTKSTGNELLDADMDYRPLNVKLIMPKPPSSVKQQQQPATSSTVDMTAVTPKVKRGRKRSPKKAIDASQLFEENKIEIINDIESDNSTEQDMSSEEEEYVDDSNDSDYVPGEDGVTRSDMEIEDTEEKPRNMRKANKPRVLKPRKPKKTKEDQIFLHKCDDCGKEHNKDVCPRCTKRKTCEVCGHKFMNKCTKCAYTCKLCGKVCWKSYRLKQHMETIHERIKKYKCDTCGLLFVAKSRLMRHRDVHKEAPDLVCSVCNKAFRHRTTFYRHRKIHTGIKPYKCSICNRDFQQKEAMKTHMRIHSTGPKRFKCLLCEKDFNHKVSLKEHMSKHHNKDEQQAAIMIGLWKKYQMEEGLSIEAPNSEVLLNRALNAVAMRPIDSTATIATISNNIMPQQQHALTVTAETALQVQTTNSSHHQPHISLVDFPYIDFVNQDIQLPLASYDHREMTINTNHQQNRELSLIGNSHARDIIMVTNPAREMTLGVSSHPRELILPTRPMTLIEHAPNQEISLQHHLQTR